MLKTKSHYEAHAFAVDSALMRQVHVDLQYGRTAPLEPHPALAEFIAEPTRRCLDCPYLI
jgi:hypothetical protein